MIAKKSRRQKTIYGHVSLKDDVFDKFLVRSVSLRTNVTYEIDCAVRIENWVRFRRQDGARKIRLLVGNTSCGL